MVADSYEGYEYPEYEFTVTRAHLERFIAAIGDKQQGTELIAPPTFQKVIEGQGDSSRKILENLGIDLKRVLHAEQEFDYGEPLSAGDRVTVSRRVSDHYFKKNGTREFLVVESEIRKAEAPQRLVGRSRQVVILRQI